MFSRLPLAALGLALALPMLGWAVVGTNARFAADDYCTASILATRGFLEAQVHWFTGYSPRFAYTFLVSFPELLGLAIVPVLPTLGILGFVAALSFALKGLLTLDGAWRPALLLGAVVAFATLNSTPDRPQSLYWQTGMITYLVPPLLLAVWIGLVRRWTAGRNRWSYPLSLLFGVLMGGINETFLITLIGGLGLAFVTALVAPLPEPLRWRLRGHLLAALAGALLALGIEALSPATTGRLDQAAPSFLLAARRALLGPEGPRWLSTWYFRHFGPTFLFVVASPWLVGRLLPGGLRQPRWLSHPLTALAAGVYTVLLVWAAYFPANYALYSDPPPRAMIGPIFVFVAFSLYLGFALRPLFEAIAARLTDLRGWAVPLATVALVLVPLSAAWHTVGEAQAASQAAARWDAVDRQLREARAAGQRSVMVPEQPLFLDQPFVSRDANDWFNVCVARWYGLDSIAARP